MLIPVQAVGSPDGQICIDMTGIEPAEYHKIRAFSQIFFYNSRGEFICELLSSSIPPVTAYSFHEEICSADLLAGDRVSLLPRSPAGPACPLLWVVPPAHNSYKVNAGLTAGAELRRSPLSSHYISTSRGGASFMRPGNARSHDRDGEKRNISGGGLAACSLTDCLQTALLH